MLGKLERVIWLASQSNKTNMKHFFDILWCQRYGTIGNDQLRGVNPLACSLCRLKQTCLGLAKSANHKVFLSNTLTHSDIESKSVNIPNTVAFICLLENDIPQKIYKKISNQWILVDKFSGYLMRSNNCIPNNMIQNEIISVQDFINLF